MELSFKSLAAGRTAGIQEVQQNVLGISKEESDELMDGVNVDPIPDDTTIKVKRKNIKLKYVPTEVPENEDSEAETLDEQIENKAKSVKKKHLKLPKIDPDSEVAEDGPPVDDETIKQPSKAGSASEPEPKKKNLKELGTNIKTKINKVKSDLKNHDSHLDKILKKMRANAAKKNKQTEQVVPEEEVADADEGEVKPKKSKGKNIKKIEKIGIKNKLIKEQEDEIAKLDAEMKKLESGPQN